MRGKEANPYLVDIEAVLETAVNVKELFPDDIYIYFLIHNNEVVYVGQTTQLMMRIGYHTTCKTFDSVNYLWTTTSMTSRKGSHLPTPPRTAALAQKTLRNPLKINLNPQSLTWLSLTWLSLTWLSLARLSKVY